jgi:hypothetical protein
LYHYLRILTGPLSLTCAHTSRSYDTCRICAYNAQNIKVAPNNNTNNSTRRSQTRQPARYTTTTATTQNNKNTTIEQQNMPQSVRNPRTGCKRKQPPKYTMYHCRAQALYIGNCHLLCMVYARQFRVLQAVLDASILLTGCPRCFHFTDRHFGLFCH